jgi:hypothetical protein
MSMGDLVTVFERTHLYLSPIFEVSTEPTLDNINNIAIRSEDDPEEWIACDGGGFRKSCSLPEKKPVASGSAISKQRRFKVKLLRSMR